VTHLLVTNDFPPKVGGIQSYLWELWRRLDPSTFTVLTTPYEGAEAFDAEQPFRVVRSREPVLLPQPMLGRRIDALAAEVGADLVLPDPALPVGLLGPHLARPYGVVLHGAEVTVHTDAAAVRTPPGWTARRDGDGAWTVAPPHRPEPGHVAVLTLENPGHDGVPVVSHVRVLTPFDGGVHDVSRLPFVAARNAVGPVERGQANGGGDPRDGGPLQVHGEIHPDGLGVSQDSEVTIAVAGAVTRFTGAVAVDDETPGTAAVAEILVDGVSVARFTPSAATPPLPFDIDITGATLLTLRTSPDSAEETHVDWLTLRLSE